MRNLSLLLGILFSSAVYAQSPRPFVPAGVTPHPDASLSTRFSGGIVFEAFDDQHGLELWWTDGTSENTQRLTDSVTGTGDGVCEPSQSHTRLFVFQEHVYFFGRNGSAVDLWRVNRQGETELFRSLGLQCPDSLSLMVDGELRTETAHLFLIGPANRSPELPAEAALWRIELPSGVADVPAFPSLGWYVAGIHVIWNGSVYVRPTTGQTDSRDWNEGTDPSMSLSLGCLVLIIRAPTTAE
ncbi:MAG: hypothetical protein IPH50_07810 [Rhodanobacteraceae bacterium]|nr:hypothetical protein [Rhodanobacteraceae bacterium]